jgi:hypothetical protein
MIKTRRGAALTVGTGHGGRKGGGEARGGREEDKERRCARGRGDGRVKDGRKTGRSGQFHKWSKENTVKATDAVRQGMSNRQAEKAFRVRKNSYYHIYIIEQHI